MVMDREEKRHCPFVKLLVWLDDSKLDASFDENLHFYMYGFLRIEEDIQLWLGEVIAPMFEHLVLASPS